MSDFVTEEPPRLDEQFLDLRSSQSSAGNKENFKVVSPDISEIKNQESSNPSPEKQFFDEEEAKYNSNPFAAGHYHNHYANTKEDMTLMSR